MLSSFFSILKTILGGLNFIFKRPHYILISILLSLAILYGVNFFIFSELSFFDFLIFYSLPKISLIFFLLFFYFISLILFFYSLTSKKSCSIFHPLFGSLTTSFSFLFTLFSCGCLFLPLLSFLSSSYFLFLSLKQYDWLIFLFSFVFIFYSIYLSSKNLPS